MRRTVDLCVLYQRCLLPLAQGWFTVKAGIDTAGTVTQAAHEAAERQAAEDEDCEIVELQFDWAAEIQLLTAELQAQSKVEELR